MKTYLAKAGEFERKYVLFDAANVPLGRLAVKIANSLRGKDRPTYTPHVDTGSFVIVINAEKVLLTGAKNENKMYESFSGYRSGHKFTKASEIRAKKPAQILCDLPENFRHSRLASSLVVARPIAPIEE